jgi:hypothetical protein
MRDSAILPKKEQEHVLETSTYRIVRIPSAPPPHSPDLRKQSYGMFTKLALILFYLVLNIHHPFTIEMSHEGSSRVRC